jgi:hypothetical protein
MQPKLREELLRKTALHEVLRCTEPWIVVDTLNSKA